MTGALLLPLAALALATASAAAGTGDYELVPPPYVQVATGDAETTCRPAPGCFDDDVVGGGR